jgi:hypothetical protein
MAYPNFLEALCCRDFDAASLFINRDFNLKEQLTEHFLASRMARDSAIVQLYLALVIIRVAKMNNTKSIENIKEEYSELFGSLSHTHFFIDYALRIYHCELSLQNPTTLPVHRTLATKELPAIYSKFSRMEFSMSGALKWCRDKEVSCVAFNQPAVSQSGVNYIMSIFSYFSETSTAIPERKDDRDVVLLQKHLYKKSDTTTDSFWQNFETRLA